MKIPGRNIAAFAKELIDQCGVSRETRIDRGQAYRNLFLTMLLGGFGGYPSDYERVGYAVAAMVVLYLVFGVHASYHRSFGRSQPPAAGVGE
jgi:VanZ family protein